MHRLICSPLQPSSKLRARTRSPRPQAPTLIRRAIAVVAAIQKNCGELLRASAFLQRAAQMAIGVHARLGGRRRCRAEQKKARARERQISARRGERDSRRSSTLMTTHITAATAAAVIVAASRRPSRLINWSLSSGVLMIIKWKGERMSQWRDRSSRTTRRPRARPSPPHQSRAVEREKAASSINKRNHDASTSRNNSSTRASFATRNTGAQERRQLALEGSSPFGGPQTRAAAAHRPTVEP